VQSIATRCIPSPETRHDVIAFDGSTAEAWYVHDLRILHRMVIVVRVAFGDREQDTISTLEVETIGYCHVGVVLGTGINANDTAMCAALFKSRVDDVFVWRLFEQRGC